MIISNGVPSIIPEQKVSKAQSKRPSRFSDRSSDLSFLFVIHLLASITALREWLIQKSYMNETPPPKSNYEADNFDMSSLKDLPPKELLSRASEIISDLQLRNGELKDLVDFTRMHLNSQSGRLREVTAGKKALIGNLALEQKRHRKSQAIIEDLLNLMNLVPGSYTIPEHEDYQKGYQLVDTEPSGEPVDASLTFHKGYVVLPGDKSLTEPRPTNNKKDEKFLNPPDNIHGPDHSIVVEHYKRVNKARSSEPGPSNAGSSKAKSSKAKSTKGRASTLPNKAGPSTQLGDALDQADN